MTEEKNLDHIYQTPGTEPVLVLFEQLLEPKPFKDPKTEKEKGDPYYQITVLIDADKVEPFKKAAAVAAKKKFGDKSFSEIVFPFKDGDKIAAEREAAGKPAEVYRGRVLLRAKAFPDRFDPVHNVLKVEKGMLVAASQSDLYGGMFGLVEIAFAGNDNGGSDRISAYLRGFVKTKDGERIGGPPTAKETFAHVVGSVTDEDPTEGDHGDLMTDEIPF